MKTLSSDKIVSRLVYDAVFLAAALLLSALETIIPLSSIPIPGFKPGLANIAVCAACFRYAPVDAWSVSLARCLIIFLLFGNPVSLVFSLFGSVLSLVAMTVLRSGRISHHFSFIGISVLCAFFHNTGQVLACVIMLGNHAVSYFPVLAASSLVFGSVTGLILNLLHSSVIYRNHDRLTS
ncbi:MAG: Gx transporter family protein [Clostridia bacterium]|nr:Gx transporter family protein [Clostridia bacterium]